MSDKKLNLCSDVYLFLSLNITIFDEFSISAEPADIIWK